MNIAGESVDPGRREALLKFVKHDNETNDTFVLAAKVRLKYCMLFAFHVYHLLFM